MPDRLHTKVLKKLLRERPGEGFILPDGNAIILLNPDRDELIVLAALDGENFNHKTDEEINNTIVETFKR